MRTRPGRVELEVYLRIGPVAIRARDGCREQTIEIAMGPKGAFDNGNFAALWRHESPGFAGDSII
jgi:hypothetical protein